MHSWQTRQTALELLTQGHSREEVSRWLGVPPSTVCKWATAPPETHAAAAQRECVRCSTPPRLPRYPGSYVYLLGLYLGDGHITQHRRSKALSIYCTASWPGLVEECATAIAAVVPNRVCRVPRQGCIEVKAYSQHWDCLFPQHGVGMKHTRPIELAKWQTILVEDNPRPLLRGLFH